MHLMKQRIKRQGQIRKLVHKVNGHLPNVAKAGPDLVAVAILAAADTVARAAATKLS